MPNKNAAEPKQEPKPVIQDPLICQNHKNRYYLTDYIIDGNDVIDTSNGRLFYNLQCQVKK